MGRRERGLRSWRDTEDLPPEHPLRGTDIADAGEQFVEVVAAAGLLQAFVVHGEAFNQVLLQLGGRPLAELRTARREHAIPDRKYKLQVIVLQKAAHPPGAFLAHLEVFLTS